jgi:hypothetical protein
MIKNFIRFFDNTGSDMNLASASVPVISAYDGTSIEYESYTGKIFFPKVSVNLIETQVLYLLQEVTGPSTTYELRKIPGEITTIGGNPIVTGVNADFTSLKGGDTIKIKNEDFTVSSVINSSTIEVSPSPSFSTTTFDIYYYDYISYNELLSDPSTYDQRIIGTIPAKTVDISNKDVIIPPFQLFSVDFTDEHPYITKYSDITYELQDGSSDTIDATTGRIQLSTINTQPTQVNILLCSDNEDIYEDKLYLYDEREYREPLILAPFIEDEYVTFFISGTDHNIYDISNFYVHRSGLTGPDTTKLDLEVVEVGVLGINTYIKVNYVDSPVGSTNYHNYELVWTNSLLLADLDLYGETEGEDERLRLVLSNFGRKVDKEKEFVFRDSDIDEDLPNYELINKKRKELLLEGDNIYPYLGSYKALINIINFFGYYDLRIKEYFLNVDTKSSNYGKYMHLLVPKNSAQREQVRDAWRLVPSSIYKKTSLFGLFYDLNTTTSNVDEHGIPEVIDAFQFSPEEVLAKLFALKELLKKEYLPLNARVYDITGEGIYFERIRLDSWADSLNHIVLDIGKRPEFEILPKEYSYITDLRRIDTFYVNKFIEQGLTGCMGAAASDPLIDSTYSNSIQSLYDTSLGTYGFYPDTIYDVKGNLLPPVDSSWLFMPPSVLDPNFNEYASRMLPLPDDIHTIAGAPILLEAKFDTTWEEGFYTWGQLSILGPTGSPLNINMWTWDSIGRGEYIDMRYTVEKKGSKGFYYDSGRKPIESFIQTTLGATAFSIPAKVNVDISGGSIVSVNITNHGYGYSTPPSVFIPGPDTPGTTASISLFVADGYVTGATWSGGSGYTYEPTITVDKPETSYELTNRILHALALPHDGDYEVGLYIYDITNSYTVDFQKYTVKNKQVDFVSAVRRETPERDWQEFESLKWEDVTGPWYYPLHIKTTWEESKINWDSLDFNSYSEQSLYEYPLNTSIYEIDRANNIVILSDNVTGQLPNSLTLKKGEYLFFTRNSSDTIKENYKIPAGSLSDLFSLSGEYYTQTIVPVIIENGDVRISGNIGEDYFSVYSSISTLNGDVYNSVSVNDRIVVQGTIYTVTSVTKMTISEPGRIYVNQLLGDNYYLESALNIGASAINSIPLTVSTHINRYTRVFVTESCSFTNIDHNTIYYDYYDITDSVSNNIVLSGNIENLILKNINSDLYMSWGIFSGTYALEISNFSVINGKTKISVKDPNKELYYIDGNFDVNLSLYDVDYAETRIGIESLKFENADEFTWNENPGITWFGLEWHSEAHCGFTIPFVSPGGIITIDEEPSFVFSGNKNINSTKSGLNLACNELNSSTNSGICKYTYKVLPEEIYVTGASFSPVTLTTDALVGDTSLILNEEPTGGYLKIPAKLHAVISGGIVTNIIIDNPGYGYNTPPVVTIDAPCGGTGAVATVTLSGSTTSGKIVSISVSGGSGYTSVPNVYVEPPVGYKDFDNYIWTGEEWLEVLDINNNVLTLASPVIYYTESGNSLLLPYDYHKQIYLNKDKFQQYYYFIHAKAINASSEMLSYITFDNNVESEWLLYPNRTYSYPLRNAFLYHSTGYENLANDHLYNTWLSQGKDYPPLNISKDYESDRLSYQSRIPYAMSTQNPFSFIDSSISDNQQIVPQFSPVILSYDNCKIPGKKNPIWTITDNLSGKTEVVSAQKTLMWNFTRIGSFTVALSIEDANGNKSSGTKSSFIVVEDFSKTHSNVPQLIS